MKRAPRHLGRNKFSKHDIEREKAPACPSFEALEPRVLLSGNVLALVVHGNLNIRGDTAANVIVLDQTDLDTGQVRISGASGTNINGEIGPIILSGITRNVFIRMGAGADSVTLSNLSLPGNVSVNDVGGVDTLTLNNVQVARTLNIHNRSSLGSTTTIATATIGKDLMIRSGSGGSNVALQSVEIQRNTKIFGGRGADILTVDDSIFHGTTRLYGGQGNDIIQIEAHGDPLGPPTLFDGRVLISLGAGNDTLQLGVAGQIGSHSVFADKTRFDGGAGYDTLLNFDSSTFIRNSQFWIGKFESNTPVTDTTTPMVLSTNPADLQDPAAINMTVSGIFSEAMNLTDVTAAENFAVTGPDGIVGGSVLYDAPNNTIIFTPSGDLPINTPFTATITGGPSGVTDLAGNPMASDKVWTFRTGTQIAQAPIDLGRAGPFAVMATDAISGGADDITGNVGLHPGTSQGIDPIYIHGTIDVNNQAIIDAQADLLAAYNDAVVRSVTLVTLSGNLGGLTFTPGLYWSESSLEISGEPGPGNILTLDAQGDPNAIFIFQMGSTLTTGPGAQVVLAGNVNPNNIFWQVGSSATLNTTTIFYGNILAAVSISVNTGSVVEGRLLAGSDGTPSGAVTIQGSTVTVPTA